ncbi:MAG: hypothetical protein ACREGE_03620 [Candidatus Microsaccharimonas sp.]
MNRDPQRTPQPADRRVINRSGSAYQRSEEPRATGEVASESSAPVSRTTGGYSQAPQKKSAKGLIWTLAAIVLVVALAVAAWMFFSNNRSGATGIDTSRYQAVFLANGQIYFGKLKDFSDESFQLTEIYYPQAQNSDTEEEGATAQTNIQLIPLGGEVHGPENKMFITKSQILYYENLKADSQVTKHIEQNQQR